MKPKVSIIINCYNQSQFLEKAIKSVLSQTFKDIECIIIDDGSTDDTRQIAKKFIKIDKKVRYYYKKNSGLPSSRNFGLKYAKGEWVQFLDADDWIYKDKIKLQLNSIKNIKNKDNIVVYSNYNRVFLDNNQKIIKREKSIIGKLTNKQLIQRLLTPDFMTDLPHPMLQQCMLIRKDIFSKIRFNEKLKALGDRYLALELAINNTNFKYVPIVGTGYTKHHSNRTNKWKYMKGYYALFYNLVHNNYRKLGGLYKDKVEFIINEIIKEKDIKNFKELLPVIKFPIYIFDKKIKINNQSSLRIAYILRRIFPNYLFYKNMRGPRSRKIFDLISRIIHQKNS